MRDGHHGLRRSVAGNSRSEEKKIATRYFHVEIPFNDFAVCSCCDRYCTKINGERKRDAKSGPNEGWFAFPATRDLRDRTRAWGVADYSAALFKGSEAQTLRAAAGSRYEHTTNANDKFYSGINLGRVPDRRLYFGGRLIFVIR